MNFIYNKERHKQLVMLAESLANQGKRIWVENPEEHLELLKYNVLVSEQVFRFHQEKFLLLMKKFINRTLNFEEFEIAFSLFYREVRKEVKMFKTNLEQIEKFQPTTEPYSFSLSMGAIFRTFEEIEDEVCTEKEMYAFVKQIDLKCQKYLNKE